MVVPLLTWLAPAGLAQSQASNESLVPSPPGGWEVGFEATGDTLGWTSTFNNESVREEVTGHLDASDSRLRYEFSHAEPSRNDPDNWVQHRANLTFEFVALYEYVDRDDDGAYDLGDRIVSYTGIGDLGDPIVELRSYPGPLQGGVVSYPLDGGGTLELEVLASAEPAWVGTRLVFPTDAEINLTVRDRPATEADTSLAMQTRIWGSDTLERGDREIEFPSGAYTAYTRWTRAAVVDGGRGDIGATILEQQGQAPVNGTAPREALLILSAPTGETSTYPISLGVFQTQRTFTEVVVQTFRGDWLLYTLGLTAAVGLVGAGAYLKLKDENERVGSGGDGRSPGDY